MPFSDRMGYSQQQPIQLESMNVALRNGLFNVAREHLLTGLRHSEIKLHKPWESRFNRAWSLFFKLPLHTSPANHTGAEKPTAFIYAFFEKAEWHRVYDFVEFLVEDAPHLAKQFNDVLEREVAGYRVLDGIVAPISDSVQLDAVNVALEASSKSPLLGAREHLSSALRLLSDRDQPDYRNSIKESISSVESAAAALTGSKKPELKDALRLLETKGRLHPALRGAFERLYGWTSDESGVRHALMEESSLDFSDAYFMLIACSAFVYYLIGKMAI
jgi:hypothetical protein